jgi:hypothetical protein
MIQLVPAIDSGKVPYSHFSRLLFKALIPQRQLGVSGQRKSLRDMRHLTFDRTRSPTRKPIRTVVTKKRPLLHQRRVYLLRSLSQPLRASVSVCPSAPIIHVIISIIYTSDLPRLPQLFE